MDGSIDWNGDFAGDYNIGAEKDSNDYNYWVKEDGKRAMWYNQNLQSWEIYDESDRPGFGNGIELSGSGLEMSKCAVELYQFSNSPILFSSFTWKYWPKYGTNYCLVGNGV